jgi:hypothetical protein
MQTCDHILAKYGVMANFSIAKKVTKERIQKMSERLNTSDESSSEFQDALKQEILKETQLAIFNNTIPGLITNSKKKINPHHKKLLLTDKEKRQVTLLTAIVVKTILEKDLSKDETCLLIIQLVNALGLRDVDFKKFTETYNPNQDDSDDFEDIDGDDNEDY